MWKFSQWPKRCSYLRFRVFVFSVNEQRVKRGCFDVVQDRLMCQALLTDMDAGCGSGDRPSGVKWDANRVQVERLTNVRMLEIGDRGGRKLTTNRQRKKASESHHTGKLSYLPFLEQQEEKGIVGAHTLCIFA